MRKVVLFPTRDCDAGYDPGLQSLKSEYFGTFCEGFKSRQTETGAA